MDPELNRCVLLNEAKGLVPGYPQSMLDILGKCNIAAVYGFSHKHLRSNMLSLVGTPLIKDRLLPRINRYVKLHLRNWDGSTVDIQEKTMNMTFLISFKQITEVELSSIYDAFKFEFDKLLVGSLSLPINIPGTKYYHGLKGRKNVMKFLKELVERRRQSPVTYDDMLDILLRGGDSAYMLSDEEIYDQIIAILYSGYETVSTTSMMAVKYLHDHPEALQELRDEHFSIRKRKTAEEPIDWDDYKCMTFTRAVIFETLRLATVVNGVLRKTMNAIELNGFVIPKGWRFYVYTREINYDPFLYPEPYKFNPWRWLDNKSLEAHKHFLIFGGGGRICPGKELGIVTVSTFLHYFVTTYRWEEIGGQKIVKFPRVEAPKGLLIRVNKF
ncbi:cytochrome P450 85A-like isoform X2 [Olea europaea var. sylvestris]|nr:cytochrome P450 85A-like isoform X2 [Olea europaea var. sylvestris]